MKDLKKPKRAKIIKRGTKGFLYSKEYNIEIPVVILQIHKRYRKNGKLHFQSYKVGFQDGVWQWINPEEFYTKSKFKWLIVKWWYQLRYQILKKYKEFTQGG